MEPAIEAARFEVRGRVQRVGYRAFVWRAARELGLRGWVRNCADALVEVTAVGPPERLRELERRLRLGPPAAEVAGVVRQPLPLPGPAASLAGFDIAADH